MKLSHLVEMIGKKPLAPGTTHLVVELLVSDEEGEDVDVSLHLLLFTLTHCHCSALIQVPYTLVYI